MKSDDPDKTNHDPESPAYRLYAEFVRNNLDGASINIQDLVAANPDLADELLSLHVQQETALEPLVPVKSSKREDLDLQCAIDPRTGLRRYKVLEWVAQGGMGVVYKVWDTSLNRVLAMKLIRGDKRLGNESPAVIVDPETRVRFVREAEITARLDHPGVVPIHEMAYDDLGRIFFTMRFVQGQRLDVVYEMGRQDQGAWTQTRILDVVVKICETIAFAHSRRVIHRDLKPENIMVGQFGETYVMDWGLAKYLPETSTETDSSKAEAVDSPIRALFAAAINQSESTDRGSETSAGTILGTAPFMPPEQAAGRIDELDERSDIYSVGAILYELLTGQRPYVPRGSGYQPFDVIQTVVAGPPARVTTLNPRVTSELVAICEKAMARAKEDRYQQMREMADDIRAYLENRVVRAHQTGAYVEFKKWVKRNRNAAIAGMVAIMTAICGLLAVVVVQSIANTQLDKANNRIFNANREVIDKNQQILLEVELKKKALDDVTESKLVAEGLLLARQSADMVIKNPCLALLLAVESNDRKPSAAANSAMLAALPLHHEHRTLSAHHDQVHIVAFSQDGSRILTASNDKTAIIWDAQTGEPLTRLIGHVDSIRSATFSPDGKLVATGALDGDRTACLWDAETGERLHVLLGHESASSSVSFSPDGKLVATGSRDGTARIWNIKDGTSQVTLIGHTAGVYMVEFSPDGHLLATGSADKTARIWDLSGHEKFCLKGHEGGGGDLFFQFRWQSDSDKCSS